MHFQRYTSKELTHFVARACKREDGTFDQESQYSRLVKILDEGRLLHRLDAPDGPARVTFLGNGSFLGRTMIQVHGVYFCDIPAQDFAIHMDKYGSFGLSFLKSFLVKRGANPAFYIAADSVLSPDDAAAVVFRGSRSPGPLTRGTLMERLIQEHMVTDYRLSSMAFDGRSGSAVTAALATGSSVGDMIRSHFLSFCVPFDSAKTDADLENYYMEREWRVVGDVRFDLDDVFRVILPKGYAKRFRADRPNYSGQVTFADE
jgi:Putative abortive phage resistance protein AbiGi, antitoxin